MPKLFCVNCGLDLTGSTTLVCSECGTRVPVESMRCITCGYDLTGNHTGTCPECGSLIDPLEIVRRQFVFEGFGRRLLPRLLLPPAVALGVSLLPCLSLILTPLAALFILGYSFVVAPRLAREAAYGRRAANRFTGLSDRSFRGIVVILFCLTQWLLTAMAIFAGCSLTGPAF